MPVSPNRQCREGSRKGEFRIGFSMTVSGTTRSRCARSRTNGIPREACAYRTSPHRPKSMAGSSARGLYARDDPFQSQRGGGDASAPGQGSRFSSAQRRTQYCGSASLSSADRAKARKPKLSEMKQCQEACHSSAGVVPPENERPAFEAVAQTPVWAGVCRPRRSRA
jgi:hypothetical protein